MSINTSPRSSFSENAYRTIARDIASGALQPGQKLNIRSIAERLGVSRTPVKEAFNRLAQEGVLTIQPQSGTYVSVLEAEDVHDLFEVRLMMETWAARRLTEDKDPARIAALEGHIHTCERLLRADPFDYEAFVDVDREFHRVIVEGAQSERLARFYETVYPQIQLMRVYWGRARERAETSHRQHVLILEAIRDAGPLYAADALAAHIRSSRADVLSHLASERPPLVLVKKPAV